MYIRIYDPTEGCGIEYTYELMSCSLALTTATTGPETAVFTSTSISAPEIFTASLQPFQS